METFVGCQRGIEQPRDADLVVLLDTGADRVVVDCVGETVTALQPS